MGEHLNIAIDGPSGAGKSTLAKAVAEKLKIRYLDTGAMYRAMALHAMRLGVSVYDEAALKTILPGAEIRVEYDERGQRVLLKEEDVTDQLRTPELSMGASAVSAHPCVREKLASLQREVGRNYDVVMDGRDITTNVLPHTRHKFFVTATPEVRAERRLLELRARGNTDETYEHVLAELITRDYNDSTRAYMPLRQANDAILVDTSHMTVDETLDTVLRAIRQKEADRA
ncbi:MAG: (d)CMP kinase [Eubacteriales bacterium]|nr:(d)CMP kinase [Eubacteriales bacterium]